MRIVVAALLLAYGTDVMALQIDCFKPVNKAAAYVIARDAVVRPSADWDSISAGRAGFGERVCVLAELASTDGRRWALVSEVGRGGSLGWMPREHLALQTELTPAQGVRAQTVSVEIGDYLGEYRVAAGGAFATRQVVSEHRCRRGERPNEYGACEDSAELRGTIKHCGTLAIAMTRDGKDLDRFRMTKGGGLCPWQYGQQPAACASLPDAGRR